MVFFVQMYKYYLCKCVNVHKYHWNYSLSVTVSFTIHIIVDLVKTLVFMRWKIAWVGEEVINSKYASVSSTCPHCLPSFQSSKHGLKKQDAKCKKAKLNMYSVNLRRKRPLHSLQKGYISQSKLGEIRGECWVVVQWSKSASSGGESKRCKGGRVISLGHATESVLTPVLTFYLFQTPSF